MLKDDIYYTEKPHRVTGHPIWCFGNPYAVNDTAVGDPYMDAEDAFECALAYIEQGYGGNAYKLIVEDRVTSQEFMYSSGTYAELVDVLKTLYSHRCVHGLFVVGWNAWSKAYYLMAEVNPEKEFFFKKWIKLI